MAIDDMWPRVALPRLGRSSMLSGSNYIPMDCLMLAWFFAKTHWRNNVYKWQPCTFIQCLQVGTVAFMACA